MAYRKRRRVAATALRRAIALASAAVLTLGIMTGPGSAPAAAAAAPTWGANAVNVLVFHGPADQQDDPVDQGGRGRAQARQRERLHRPGVQRPGRLQHGQPRQVPRRRVPVRQRGHAQRLPGSGVPGVRQGRRRVRRRPRRGPRTARLGVVHRADRQPAGAEPAQRREGRGVRGQRPRTRRTRVSRTSSTVGPARSGWPSPVPPGCRASSPHRRSINRYALTSANDFAGRDPKELEAAGLHRRSELDRPGHAGPTRCSPSGSRPGSSRSPTPPRTSTTGWTSRPTAVSR